MTFCPFCGVRQDVDLRQIHYRDLGEDQSLACPDCVAPLHILEMDTQPALRIERCPTCFGMLFNPGELEAALESQTHPLVWLDPPQLEQIASDYGHQAATTYRRCPMCPGRMGHLNFGGRSGVILDLCPTHGVWVKGSQLRRLAEWWRAGGKLIFQNHQAERARRLHPPPIVAARPKMTGTTESPTVATGGVWGLPLDPLADPVSLVFDVIEAVVALASD